MSNNDGVIYTGEHIRSGSSFAERCTKLSKLFTST